MRSALRRYESAMWQLELAKRQEQDAINDVLSGVLDRARGVLLTKGDWARSMIVSERKRAANRRNARRSRGRFSPERQIAHKSKCQATWIGGDRCARSQVERNHLHGVRALCGHDYYPRLAEVAAMIVQCDVILRAVRKEKELAIDRVREPTVRARARQDEWYQHATSWFEEVKVAALEFEYLTGASIGEDAEDILLGAIRSVRLAAQRRTRRTANTKF